MDLRSRTLGVSHATDEALAITWSWLDGPIGGCSLVERIEVGSPEEERGPSTVRFIGGLALVLAFVSEHEGEQRVTASASYGASPGPNG
jgi:hypothetical protein